MTNTGFYDDTSSGNFEVIGICYRCQQPVGYVDGHLTDTSWDEERCYPHEDPQQTHLTRDVIIKTAISYGVARPAAVWNALACLVRAERVPVGLRKTHIKSASRALAGGRAD